MACTIDTTIGGSTANSYISSADADTYHERHIAHETWDDADTDDKCRSLQTASRLLDQWYEWIGVACTSSQALLWPRLGAIGPNGYLLASDAIPVAIANATAELARQLLDEDRTKDSDIERQGLKSLTAGSVAMTFGSVASSKPIPDAVMAMVSAYGTIRSKVGGAVTLRRG